ncbi:MAG: hypothetical protein WAV89_01820 [Ignavibacteriaceae bacterium]
MGKSILIITLGLSLIIGFIILKLNTNATHGVETTVNKFDQTHARLIANSAVEIQLEKLKWDKSYGGSFSGTLFGGLYSGAITYTTSDSSKIIIRAHSKFQDDAIHYVRVDAEREPIDLVIQSALTISTQAFTSLNITGTQLVSGFEHDTSGAFIDSVTPPPVSGITVDSSSQVLIVANSLSNGAIVEGKGPLVKVTKPGNKEYFYSIAKSTTLIDWAAIGKDIASSADLVLGSPGGDIVLTNFNEGSILDPKIVRIDGSVSLPGGSAGAGILVVNGNLTLLGGFTWKGLIIAYADNANIEIKLTGGATIIGGMVLQGKNTKLLNAGGNQGFELLYSSLAMTIINNNLKNSSFNIVSWWE